MPNGQPLSTTQTVRRTRRRATAPAASTEIESAADRETLIAAIFLAEPVQAPRVTASAHKARSTVTASHRPMTRRLAAPKGGAAVSLPTHVAQAAPARRA